MSHTPFKCLNWTLILVSNLCIEVCVCMCMYVYMYCMCVCMCVCTAYIGIVQLCGGGKYWRNDRHSPIFYLPIPFYQHSVLTIKSKFPCRIIMPYSKVWIPVIM